MSSPAQYENFAPPPAVRQWQRRSALVTAPLAAVTVIGWALSGGDAFYQGYLLGYMWVLGLSLGSLALLMLYHTTGGHWGTVIRRQLEASASTLWLLALGLIPILVGAHHLYPWARPEEVAKNPDLQRLAEHYLNLPMITGRAVIYFAVWLALAGWLLRQSRRQDRESVVLDAPLRRVSGLGMVLYALTITFASVDWVMSLSAPWSSTIFGLLYLAGQGLIALSFAVAVLAGLVRYDPMKRLVQADQFLDHGKLMLAFTMLWGWFTLSQWLIVWAGNLPDEISWYLERSSPGWHIFSGCVVFGQFFVPFCILLSRGFKLDARKLQKLALYIIFIRYWDLFWYIVPNFRNGSWGYAWPYAVVPLAMLSCWLTLFFYQLNRHPLMAVHDDHVELILEEEHELERA